MTRDEQRNQCIEAMRNSWLRQRRHTLEEMAPWYLQLITNEFTIAFDALHGIVRVSPLEVTEEAIELLMDGCTSRDEARIFYNEMMSEGDLTNAEKQS